MEWSIITAIKSPFDLTISSSVSSPIFSVSVCVFVCQVLIPGRGLMAAWRWHFIGWICVSAIISYILALSCSVFYISTTVILPCVKQWEREKKQKQCSYYGGGQNNKNTWCWWLSLKKYKDNRIRISVQQLDGKDFSFRGPYQYLIWLNSMWTGRAGSSRTCSRTTAVEDHTQYVQHLQDMCSESTSVLSRPVCAAETAGVNSWKTEVRCR